MNNIENAIKTLKILYDTADVTTVEGIRLKRDIPIIIKACEKQIARSPVVKCPTFLITECPHCNGTVKFPHKHCHWCGQKLDWSEAEDE